MESKKELFSSKSNFYFSPTKQSNVTFRTAKLFHAYPHLSNANSMSDIRQGITLKLKTAKSLFPRLKKETKSTKYNSSFLKQDLMTYRSEINQRKNELHFLRIKYNKLLLDNIYNKTLLARILEIPMNKAISKQMVFTKIRNCRLTPEKKQTLLEAHEIITLKLDIENKKNILEEKILYLNNLEKNSKKKIVGNLENDYFLKCEKQRSLLKKLEKLEKKYNLLERKINEENEKIKMENINYDKLIDKEVEKIDGIQKIFEEKCNIIKQINQLVDKIKRLEKANNDKEKQIKDQEKEIGYDEQKYRIINEYKKILPEEQTKIHTKTKNKEGLESSLKDCEKELKTLSEEYDKLYSKMFKYREEKPKLIRKAVEPRKDIEKMESLKKELEELKKTKEKTEKNHVQRQKDLKEINDKDNKDNEQYMEIISKNNNNRDELNKQIDEINSKLIEINTTNNNLFNKLTKEKNEFNRLCQNLDAIKKQFEQNEQENKENREKLEEEKTKERNKKTRERKRDIDRLKKEQNKYSNENRKFAEQNKILQDELNDYNKNLENFDQIKKELNDAVAKLNSLKNN